MEKAVNKPEIRYKGFTDAWEQRKLGELSERVIVGLATSVTPYYRSEGTPILRNLNIKENFLDDSDILFLDEEYADGQTGKKIHTGDVLTVHTGYIGTSCVVPEKYDGCLTFTTLITTTKSSRLNGEYLSQYLNSEMGLSAVQMVTTQGGRQNLNTNDFVNVPIPYPSIEEQGRICDFLRNLDNLITLHQRKCDKLVKVKKAMLVKMFPRNGETVPEIRFHGFTDAWEQRKLGDYVDIVSGDAPSKFEDGNELYVKVDDLNYNLKYVTDSQSKVAIHKSIKKALKGSVVFPKRGAAIMTNKVRILAEDSYMDTNMMALSSDRIDSEFLYNVISKEGLYKIADTSTIPQINNKHIEPYEVMLPNMEEQKRIGEFFEDMDNLIALHQCKLEKLKNIKKSMHEKMFV